MSLWEDDMFRTDFELRAELARVDEESVRYGQIMAEMEERTLIRRSQCSWARRRAGGHSAVDPREGG